MTFGDKLMNLRKKEGLSQEQLGDKLNVTRQTVSKWELNQTIPDMNKLKEISNLFGVSVESLTSEEDSNINNSTVKQISNNNEFKPRKWLLIVLIILALIIAVILLDKAVSVFNEKRNARGGIFNFIQDTFNDITGDVNKNMFNSTFEIRVGTEMGSSVGYLLDDVIENNKKNKDKLITVKYADVNTSNPEEIKNLKKNFDPFNKYEVSADYNDEGYISLITIENLTDDIVNEENQNNIDKLNEVQKKSEEDDDLFDKNVFNQKYELYTMSTTVGVGINSIINNVISDNTKGEHIVEINFDGETSSDINVIKGFSSKIDKWSDYSVSVDYDEKGYVNIVYIREV